jgi:hypothetical protein
MKKITALMLIMVTFLFAQMPKPRDLNLACDQLLRDFILITVFRRMWGM